MKKFSALILSCIFMLSIFACGTNSIPNETTTHIPILKETTSFPIQSEKTTSTTTRYIETTADPITILNELSKVPSIAMDTNGNRQKLFDSFVCAHVNNSNAVADGILILQSLENVIGQWVSEGKIPTIILDAKSELVSIESDIVLTEPITFYIYQETNGVYRNITSLKNATISDVYNYGVNNLKETNTYIRFNISQTTDGGNATYAYIMHVIF